MNEIDKIRVQSKNLARLIIVEFGYGTVLYFILKAFIIQTDLITMIYVGLLFVVPLAFNIYVYYKSKKNTKLPQTYHLIIAQILILIFSFQFLM